MSIYTSIQSHLGMNFDAHRNAAYARAIRAAVTSDSVVLDLGAGLGQLGLIAARAGARKVYLVEPEPVIEVTRKVVQHNGLDNVVCLQARAETLDLPEPVNLVLSVMTGNFLLTEDLLPALFQARDRWLAPGGKMIPDRGRLWVMPVSCADYYRESVDCCASSGDEIDPAGAGVDYRPARAFAANSVLYDKAAQFKARPLAAPACLDELDFLTATKAECDASIEISATTAGTCHGWLGWFDMRLGNEWLSTAPDAEPMHWRQVLLPLEHPIDITRGQQLSFRLRRPEFGEWTWVTETEGQRQSQSTFLSIPVTPERVARQAESFKPTLTEQGQAIEFLLARFDGRHSVAELADALLERYPVSFGSRQQALRLVRWLVHRNS